MKDLEKKRVDQIIRFAIKEDVGTGDITSQAVVDRFLDADAVIISRQTGVVCGMEIIERVFASVDYNLRFRPMVSDGDMIEPGQEVAFVEGVAQSILKAERTALNFLGLLSGVSTSSKKMGDGVEGTGVKIYDTRKTIPLHRYFEKYAVSMGGGYNHRKGLWDMVLIKDNHIRAMAMQMKNSDSQAVIKEIIKRARASVQKNIRIEIEVETLKECECALDAKPEVIMLDNMSPEMISEAVVIRNKKGLSEKVLFEVSGGITLDNVKQYALSGVDIISTGSITGEVKPVDFSLEIIFKK